MLYVFWLSAIFLLTLTSVDAQLGCGLNYYNYNRYYPCTGGMGYSPFSYGNSYGSYSPYNSMYSGYGYGRQMNPYMYNGFSPLGGYNSGLGFQGLGYGMSPFSGISPYSGIYGGGVGTLDYLNGGNLYGAPGYSGTSFPFQQQFGIQPFGMMNQEPFTVGPDGMPFVGNLGASQLLPRPFHLLDEGSIFNTPFTGPLKKHAAQHSTKTIPKTTVKDDHVKTQIVSLDQLINEMDKMSK